jgi:hypothetical protein
VDENGGLQTASLRLLTAAKSKTADLLSMTQVPCHTSMEAFAFLDHLNVNFPPKMAQLQIADRLRTGDLGFIGPQESRTAGISGGVENIDRVMVPIVKLTT